MKILRSYKEARRSLERALPYDITSGEYNKIETTVKEIIQTVKKDGDSALYRYTERFSGARLKCLETPPKVITAAYKSADRELIRSLKIAARRIRNFHKKCKQKIGNGFVKDGVGQKILPLERVGIYIPGGTASYPSTVLMTAIPARVAGVREIIMVTPCDSDGNIPVNTLAAARIAGVDRVFKIGGAQAIAALAFGTRSIPRVDKICGPGNIYVMMAKKLLYGMVGIDALQGPSEVVVIADTSVDPAFCAADLIAQSEHDAMASAVFITTSESMAWKVQAELNEQMKGLKRKAIAASALTARGYIVIVQNLDEAIELANLFAPEHLSLMVNQPDDYIHRIKNAGCICVGPYSPVVLGDYIAGPSHALPTGGSARFSSPLVVQDFLKVSSIISLAENAIDSLGPVAVTIAENEGLNGHARAIRIRLNKSKKND